MKLADALAEAHAIDQRALGALLPSTEDILRAMDLVQFFADKVEAEPTDERKAQLSLLIVSKLNGR